MSFLITESSYFIFLPPQCLFSDILSLNSISEVLRTLWECCT